MTIIKAIEILNQYSQHLDVAIEPDLVDAMKLGIEAGKAYLAFRTGGSDFFFPFLPGETVD